MTPTARTLKWCKENGLLAGTVERYNHHTRQSNDLFGFIDIIAIDGTKTIGIQATSGSNVSARVKKIKAEARAHDWLSSPRRLVVVHGWVKRKPRGQKRPRWELREVWIFKDDLLP